MKRIIAYVFNYDAALGMWFNTDPMLEKYNSLTPYNYCFNNPVNLTDPNGMDPLTGSNYKEEKVPEVYTGAGSPMRDWGLYNKGYSDCWWSIDLWLESIIEYDDITGVYRDGRGDVIPTEEALVRINTPGNIEETYLPFGYYVVDSDGNEIERTRVVSGFRFAQADGRAAWLDDPDSFHNSTFARILYPDAWVITGVGTIAWKGGVSVEIGTVIMQRGPKAGKRRDFIMPAGEAGYAFNGGIKIMGINFAGPVSEIDFSRFQSLAINADLSIIQAPKIGFSATWSPDPTMESFGVLGRGGSFGGGFLPASATVGVGYPFWISDEY